MIKAERNCPAYSERYLCETPCSDGCPYNEGEADGEYESAVLFKEFLDKVIAKIDFEEKWLEDVRFEKGRITTYDVNIAMDAIRHLLREYK